MRWQENLDQLSEALNQLSSWVRTVADGEGSGEREVAELVMVQARAEVLVSDLSSIIFRVSQAQREIAWRLME